MNAKLVTAWFMLTVASLGTIILVELVSPVGFNGSFGIFVDFSLLRWSALFGIFLQPLAVLLLFGKSLILIKGNLCAPASEIRFKVRALLGRAFRPFFNQPLLHGFLSYLWYPSIERFKILLVFPAPATGGVHQ